MDINFLLKHKRTAVAVALASALTMIPFNVNAKRIVDVNQYFQFVVYEVGDTYEDVGDDDNPVGKHAVATPSADTIEMLKKGLEYYSPLFGNNNNNIIPVRIALVQETDADGNASAYSGPLSAGQYRYYTALTGALFKNYYGDNGLSFFDELADVTVNYTSPGTDWYRKDMENLPTNGVDPDLQSTMIHELGHALGIATQVRKNSAGNFEFIRDGYFLFTSGITDIYGNHAKPGMEIGFNEGPDSGKFVVHRSLVASVGDRYDTYTGAYFTGKNVAEVLNGALIAYPAGTTPLDPVPGIPINCFEETTAEFSHLEPQNGLMSHQNYRNWNVMMEAELAVLQDCGVEIDRRNAYGYSIYNSGTESNIRYFVNTNPYYKRTSDGQWIYGEHNPTNYGIGLHVYGSYNSVLQKSELLSSGNYGIGIRVDGVHNEITIPAGTRVEATGKGGIGVLYSWGKEHQLNIAGSVKAAGNAVQFDFGDNCLGNTMEYQGSYIRLGSSTEMSVLDEISGPLVSNFNLSGSIEGGKNAIYISSNAYVENINILRGASITGNILSEWNPSGINRNSGISTPSLLTTDLTFGLAADANGKATDKGDPLFNLTYNGNITGKYSIVLKFAGGKTSINGNVYVLSATVEEGATLGGNAVYTLYDDSSGLSDRGTFTNYGKLSPGNSIGEIVVNGEYIQESTGVLHMEYGSGGSTDRLKVSGDANFGGSLHIEPYGSYFASGAVTDVSLSDMIIVGGTQTLDPGFISSVLADQSVQSPTLLQNVRIKSGGGSIADTVFSTTITRRPLAYSRFATGGNAKRLGYGFDIAADNALGAMQKVVAALDYSSMDGSDIAYALDRMNPSVYANAVQGVFDHQQIVNDFSYRQMNSSKANGSGISTYAQTYLTHGSRGHGSESIDRSTNFGVMAGFDNVSDSGFLKGLYLDANQRYTKTRNYSSVHDTSLYGGVKVLVGVNPDSTLTFAADARVGFDRITAERGVAFLSVADSHKNDYTALGSSISAKIGYDMKGDSLSYRINAGFDYHYLRTPEVDEGLQGTALTVDKESFNSLKACIGLDIAGDKHQLTDDVKFGFNGSLIYRYELIDRSGVFNARFNNAANADFTHEVYSFGRNSIDVLLTPVFGFGQADLEFDVGGSVYPGEGGSVFGRVNYLYRF
ncbi:MAG: autotransporter domain-containing protein [Succinivibrio sp.]